MTKQELISHYATFAPVDEKLHNMIPQEGVTHSILPPEIKHNAIWDYHISPEGRHFFSVCAEGNYSEYAHLYEYMPKTGELKLCFKLDDVIVTYDRTIRPSKLHESFSFLPDGRLIMTTHTTATAPNHPVWMPLAYYDHQWEGYPGSNILIYDPATNTVEDLGIPVPRVTIYGGVYEKTTHAYYFGDYTRGHLYKLDLSNRHLKDYGQVVEIGSFRYIVGPDSHVYFSSKSGTFQRVNTKTDKVEELGIQFPVYENQPETICHNQLTHCTFGPDGKLYLNAAFGNELLRYDFAANTLEQLGRFTPSELRMPGKNREDVGGGGENSHDQLCGVAFDKDNVLWYVCGGYLTSWDVLNVKEPINHGLLGSPKRKCGYVQTGYIRDDVYYVSDTNHYYDPPGIISVKLDTIRSGKYSPVKCRDATHYVFFQNGPQLYDGDIYEDVKSFYEDWHQEWQFASKFMEENPSVFSTSSCFVTKIWKNVPVEESSVNRVWYDENDCVHALAGEGNIHHVVLKESKVISVNKETKTPAVQPCAEALFANVRLPSRPGRQYLAQASAWASLKNGKKIVGTKDGMLAVVSDDKVYSLGVCALHGPVHEIVSDRKTAYGVAGDPSDLGTVFSYNEDNGLTIHGRVYIWNANTGGLGASCEPCCLALSKDGTKLAIGARDRQGCVYEYDLSSGIKPLFLD